MMTTEQAATGRDAATAPGPTGPAHGYCGRCGWGTLQERAVRVRCRIRRLPLPARPGQRREPAIGASPLTDLPVNPREPIR